MSSHFWPMLQVFDSSCAEAQELWDDLFYHVFSNFAPYLPLVRCRIKCWQALEKRVIHHPHAYIQLIVRSEFIDMLRKQKLVSPLPTDEEWANSEFHKQCSWNIPDPAEEVEQQLETAARLKEIIQAVLELPARQR